MTSISQPLHDASVAPAVASLVDVTAGYGDADVLHRVSLDLAPGRVCSLFGPNGAGKSTLVRVLTGTLPLRRGHLQLPRSEDNGRRPVGLVPQEIALYPWLTALENCVAFACLDGMPRANARSRANEVLMLAGCEDVAGLRVSRLSGGYRRRVNIAVALMSRPALLILDEPTVGLDSEARRSVVELLRAVARSGAAILLVTHDFEVAAAATDDLIVLRSGTAAAQGEASAQLSAAFGAEKLVEFIFAAEPSRQQQDFLISQGATQGLARTSWLWPRPASLDASRLSAMLAQTGLAPVEIRVRQPRLEDFYALVLHRSAAP